MHGFAWGASFVKRPTLRVGGLQVTSACSNPWDRSTQTRTFAQLGSLSHRIGP